MGQGISFGRLPLMCTVTAGGQQPLEPLGVRPPPTRIVCSTGQCVGFVSSFGFWGLG